MLWEGVGFDPLPEETIRMLLARGITQHIRLDAKMIPTAKALQAAGSPVIVMEGKAGAWPYPLAGDPALWAHQYPPDQVVPPEWRSLPNPARIAGWSVAADQIRETLRSFKSAGVNVNAIWLDYENEPAQASYAAALASPTTRAELPAAALASEREFRNYTRQLWQNLLSTYVAAPIREIYPAASVTNWITTISTPERALRGWTDEPHPPSGPTEFTATNPIAYAIDTYFLNAWKPEYPLDQRHVDRFYTHVLLRQVSDDAYNRAQIAPHMISIPWVARWVPDHPRQRTPVMSREAYREALRHLWLRGISGMLVFNPVRADYEHMALTEVEDAAAVYAEMFAFREFLEKSEVMNYEYPGPQDNSVLWSGLRLYDELLVRTTNLGGSRKALALPLRTGGTIEIEVPPGNSSYRHVRASNRVPNTLP